MPAQQTAFRLTDEDLALLDALKLDRGFSTRVDALRFAIRESTLHFVKPGSEFYGMVARARGKSPENLREAARVLLASALEQEADAWEHELKAGKAKRHRRAK